jgi:methylmalonyl-CoA mutase N-terminal domain/subunit
LPSERAVQVALRTQQIIAEESGAADVVDPLGGSYYVESLTNEIEKRVQAYLDEIDRMGGSLKAIEKGYVQQEIANSAYEYQKAVDAGEQVIVGVNKYATKEHHGAELLHVGAELEAKQMERLRKLRAGRDNLKVKQVLEKVSQVAQSADNVMPVMIEAVETYATLGEIGDALRQAFGEYRERNVV